MNEPLRCREPAIATVQVPVPPDGQARLFQRVGNPLGRRTVGTGIGKEDVRHALPLQPGSTVTKFQPLLKVWT